MNKIKVSELMVLLSILLLGWGAAAGPRGISC